MRRRPALLALAALTLGCADRVGAASSDDSQTTDTGDPSAGDGDGDDTDEPPMTVPSPPNTCELYELAVTRECVVGESVLSVEFGTLLCQDEFGDEWSWLEFHATWGWHVEGQLHPEAWSIDARAWVWIDDQDAECFSSPTREITEGEPERFGMTWRPVEASESCRAATCNDPFGLDEPGLDPLDTGTQLQCNPYAGDTPCSRCRPLLCIRER